MGLRIAICQSNAVTGEVGINLNRALSILSQTKADVYVFPELFLTGYGADYKSVESEVQYALDKLRIRCMEMDIAIVMGAPAYLPDGMRNSLYFITHKGADRYDKLYLAKFGVYSEDAFVPGKIPVIGEFKGMKFGLSICYDIFFPEIYRNYAVSGADVNICIAASAGPSREYLERILPARSLENVIYTLFVNNISDFGDQRFYGRSRLLGPLGNVLTETGGGEEIVCTYVDHAVVENARKERRHLADLRKDIHWNA
ncbi:MAG: carbon-nitrogen hydrolase family protein [Candidatus Methanoplasma sp.]|jgi:predicted amidohydrolase|nr:carbon-nitrogen hydrolase family protein [Candidatus Methanoplasma sp.]